MDRTELYQVLTLWFAAMIFLQTGSGDGHPVVGAFALVALVVMYVVPVYLVLQLVVALLGE